MLDLAALPALPRTERVQAIDGWLAGLLADALAGTPRPQGRRGTVAADEGTGIALVAVGSLGRREPAPLGDLDLVLVHDGRPEIAALADALWYPIWDAGVRLDHSVRQVSEAVAVAGSDVKAGLGLLDARHVAGDPVLAATLRSAALASWRQSASRLLPELRDIRRERARQVGELGFLLEPDLKEAYGGLREGQVLRALSAAQVADEPAADAGEAYAFLLDVRDQLRRLSGRPSDVLVRQEQARVADALGLPDDDALIRQVSLAGRRLAFVADETWRRAESAIVRRPRARYRRVRREPLAEGVVRQGDEVVLARDARPAVDPGLVLRGAAAAARADLLLSPYTLKVLAAHAPQLPEPWPPEVRWSLLRLLASGRSAVAVIEQLDQEGLLSRMLPEWDRVRSLPQRHPWHRFTVDRHLVEAAAAAAELTRDVDRPDLLLVGALLHDIGKGWPGDHTDVGVVVIEEMAVRMGFAPPDVATLVAMVRHHLLLPDIATHRDLDDPATIEGVVSAIGADPALLQLLHALAQADGAATSSSAWSPWKAHLVAALVGRVQARLGAAAAPDPVLEPTTPQVTARAPGSDGTAVQLTVGVEDVADGQQVSIGAPDRPGLLSICAGVLALNQLDVRAAKVTVDGGGAVLVFAVRPRFGRAPVPEILADGLRAALEGTLPLAERLRQREADYRQDAVRSAPPRISWHDTEATGVAASRVELRAGDRAGLLYRLTAALADTGLDVVSAHVETLGADAVDSFYVADPTGTPIDAGQRARAEAVLVAAARGEAPDPTDLGAAHARR
ncbi:[protein-PII] uridylyltransferase [Modestobacter sp. I12A-02628]|uniref:Bifunctional uridylyltransferase/uridylyl-removing enzyme n=1 Tax=Goekera deserti TaxID=2497753 RepID=A0A7K3WH06_9ACTN|nr:[protein-PII] uridylyltransferase [Goekera deserti]MPQ97276.1 [protein-PII] uridylyltransferase [Goekera deserti]NDI50213.1 [protein-PII] uridylyltransferase [Goekera deserti]NEL55781.1 [protein-PII] uridylyltransferase [Goekera deserti]